MKFIVPRYINIISLIGIIAIAAISMFADLYMKRLTNAYMLVERTYGVIAFVNQIPFVVNKLEIQLRGFLLTKDKSYLKNYDTQLKSIYVSLADLQKLTNNDPKQIERIKQFEDLVKKRLQLLQLNASRGLNNNIELAIKSVASEGRPITENVDALSEEIVAAEVKYLHAKTQAIHDNYNQVASTLRVGNLVSFGLILLSVFLLNYQLFIQDRTQKRLKRSEDRLLQLAYYDQLTKLANRTFLFQTVDEMITKKNKLGDTFALFLIDVDNFKNINDASGYEIGDEILIRFSQRLVKLFGKDNNFIAHMGADKFVVVLNKITHMTDITAAAQQILNSTQRPLTIDKHSWFISVSIGISIFPNNGTNARALMKNADIAVYRAKELGKNNYQFCTPEMTIAVEERALLDTNLHKALVNKEFVLVYQPKINLKNGFVTGVEALMRWKRSDHELVNPINFISLAESNGLIVPIGEWMIREACIQGKNWCNAGLCVNLAINLSPRQLVISNFVESIKKILAETGFDSSLLEFEITESILLEHSSSNLAALKALKDLGITITIDDFGTGYSSLNYLKVFDVDKLKIDKTFIDEIREANDEQNIIIAIIAMAHSLGISVIAEGVENSTQFEFLKQHDCDEVQGFFYSLPLTANEILPFVRQFNSHLR